MWIITLILSVIAIKIYNTISSGKCYSDSILTGKVAVVTGGNSGVGFETCLDLAQRGAKVIVTCPNETQGKKAVRCIIRKTKSNRVRYEHLDLTSLESVRKFVEDFKKTDAKLDILINNASAHCTDRRKTKDGIIRDMQVNHFGPFLLTLLLVPWLKKCFGRIVIVSSYLHRFGTIEKINEDVYGTFRTFANSKLCNVLFCNELARRLKGSGVTVNSADSGILLTFVSKILGAIPSMVLLPFLKTFKDAAQTIIYLAVSVDCDQEIGKYFVDCTQGTTSRRAQDESLAEELWLTSEKLVKLRPDEAISG